MSVRRSMTLIMILAATVAACSTDEGAPAPSENPPTSALPSPVESPSAEALPEITGPCCPGSELDPVRYASPGWFTTPFSIEVGDGLIGWQDLITLSFAVGRGENDVSHLDHYMSFFSVDTDSDILDELAAFGKLRVGEIEPITVAGVDGLALDAQAAPSGEEGNEEIQPGTIKVLPIDRLVPGFWYSESGEAKFRFVLLTIGDSGLFVSIEAPPDGFDAFAEEALGMLQTMEIAAV